MELPGPGTRRVGNYSIPAGDQLPPELPL